MTQRLYLGSDKVNNKFNDCEGDSDIPSKKLKTSTKHKRKVTASLWNRMSIKLINLFLILRAML
jgi:hypothetical protein